MSAALFYTITHIFPTQASQMEAPTPTGEQTCSRDVTDLFYQCAQQLAGVLCLILLALLFKGFFKGGCVYHIYIYITFDLSK